MTVNKKKLILPVIIICVLFAAAIIYFFKDTENSLPFDVGEDEYVIVLLSDTQFYSRSMPETFNAMTAFLAENKDALNIEFVVHTGDIVNSPYEQEQWQNADIAMQKLADIPHGVLPGNHDTGNGEDRYIDYRSYFGEERFKDKAWYGASHEGNRGHYDLVSMGSQDFIIVYLSDDPAKCCIDFAKEAFADHPDRIGILCTHNYLEDDCSLTDMGEYMQDNILADNENVRMVLCGHNSVTGYATSMLKNADGSERTVQQLIANYQDSHNDGGGGYMLFLIVNEQAKTIKAITYSPVKNDFEGHVEEGIADEFTISLPW